MYAVIMEVILYLCGAKQRLETFLSLHFSSVTTHSHVHAEKMS